MNDSPTIAERDIAAEVVNEFYGLTIMDEAAGELLNAITTALAHVRLASTIPHLLADEEAS